MKIKLSKSQWEQVGKTAGWLKVAQVDPLQPIDGVQKAPNSNAKFKKDNRDKIQKSDGINETKVEGQNGQNDPNDPFKKMRHIKVTFDDGEVLETQINGTKKTITDYYTKNQFVKDDEVTMQRGVKVEFFD